MASQLAFKDIDFLPVISRKVKTSKLNKRARSVLIAMGALLLVMGGLFAAYIVEANAINAQKDEVNAYLLDTNTISVYAAAKENRDSMLIAQNKANALVGMLQQIEAYPKLSSGDYRGMLLLGGGAVQLNSVSYFRLENKIELQLSAADVKDISAFMSKLRSFQLFASASYGGYKLNSYMTYDFDVTCVLKEGEDNV